MKYYGFWRSLAACRVRIALALKGVKAEEISVNLMQGEQLKPEYVAVNPLAVVPSLDDGGGTPLFESLAIIEYLDEIHPEPPLLPGDAGERARIRAFALAIACDIHPLNNLRVLNYLKGPLQQSQAAVDAWYRQWVEEGLAACEALLPAAGSRFCFGDQPTLADVVLVPQVYNARRFKCDLSAMPRLVAVEERARALAAFADAAPEAQPDAA
jgi:maleylacetoacetate isomerase